MTTAPQSPWLLRKEAAAYTGLAVSTLENYAVLGKGPRFIVGIDRRARYSRAELDAWISEGTVKGAGASA